MANSPEGQAFGEQQRGEVFFFLVSSQCSIVQEKSGQCHARFPPASCLTHLALINSWLTGTERVFFFFFFEESYRRRGGYELTALLAHNLVFRKHLRACVWYQASTGVFKSGYILFCRPTWSGPLNHHLLIIIKSNRSRLGSQ